MIELPGQVVLPGLVNCHACNLLVAARSLHHGHGQCPRCGGGVHLRKTNSLVRTWALLIAAAICYLPANLLPIMTVISFGKGQPDTILSGVQELIHAGMYPVAILVFFASIFVPVLKIVLLAYLLLSVHFKSVWRPRDRTIMYRITEAVGRVGDANGERPASDVVDELAGLPTRGDTELGLERRRELVRMNQRCAAHPFQGEKSHD